MQIAFVGKFSKLHDEEYIARSFEMLGHTVRRIPDHTSHRDIENILSRIHPKVLIYCKWEQPPELDRVIGALKREGMKTVCWVFDLYFNYTREWQVKTKRFFKSDYVFTTDGGNEHRWKELGINHHCVRQGIYAPECFIEENKPKHDVTFVGSDNPYYPERAALMQKLAERYDFAWYGRSDTDEIRGTKLNTIFSETKVVVGDSFPSPNYWSNRVVETLGRGGFLIHKDVPGLKEAYPHLVTYDGTLEDLKAKIDYYLTHEDERLDIVRRNHQWVKDNYTCEKQCQKLLSYIS